MDYFSSLLKQTGIKVKPDVEPGGQFREEASREPHASADISPTEVEEHEVVELPPSGIKKGSDVAVSGASEPPARSTLAESEGHGMTGEAPSSTLEPAGRPSDAEGKTRQDRYLEKSELKEAESVSWQPQQVEFLQSRLLAEETPTETPKTEPEITEIRYMEDVKPKLLSSVRPGRQLAEETLTETPNIEPEIRYMEDVKPQPLSSVQAGRPSKKTASASKQTPGDKDISREQVMRAVYKEVRNWVAGQAALTTEEQRLRVEAEVVGQVRQALPEALDQRQGAVVFQSRQNSPEEKTDEAEIATQHLHLSIGPISVSIEQPERELKTPRKPPGSGAQSMPDTRSSRLSRNYVFL